jgi:hypothetical protein
MLFCAVGAAVGRCAGVGKIDLKVSIGLGRTMGGPASAPII